MMKAFTRFLAFVISTSLTLTAADPMPRVSPESVGLSAAKLREATAVLGDYVAQKKVAGAVAAVARHGRVAYVEAAGYQTLDTSSPMTERSLFRIYSMTKPVTSVAVMMLFEEGKFRLAEPVSKYLPAFKQVTVLERDGSTRSPAREITIEDLLLHISGLSHRTSEVYRRAEVRSRSISLPQFVDNIVRVPLMEDPHTRYRYSEATTVLGRLVEVWSGMPFERFLEERVLRPLGMDDTMFWVPPAARDRLTTVYAPGTGGLTATEIEAVPFTERPALIEGAVGLVSTVPDYVRFAQMLLNRGELGGVRLLKAETVDMMTRNGLPDAILQSRGGGSMGWGLGNVNIVLNPARLDYPANRGEYGWDGTAGTIFWVDPSKELVTVLMTQSSPANPDGIRQRFKTIVQQSLLD